MKRTIIHLIKGYPLSLVLIVGIWVICLIPIPETPLSGVSFIDKWTHIALYFILCTSIYWEYLKHHHQVNKRQLCIIALLIPLLMGGLIELVQATCTNGNRSGDWYDFIANSIGVVLAQFTGILLVKYFSK